MIKSVLKISAVSLLAMAIAGLPLSVLAQSTNKPAATTPAGAAKKDATAKDTSAKKKSAHPFHGKLAAVDKTAKTIKVGESIYQITSETRIEKAGKPAMLEDGVVGEEVAGYAKPTDDGKMAASSVRFGPKPEGTTGAKKKDTAPK